MEKRNRQLIRTWEVVRTLEVRSATITELAREFGVHWRTIARDIAALEEVGFPLVVDEGHRWHIIRRRETPVRPAQPRDNQIALW